MRKGILVVVAAVCALAWTSRSAYALNTISCQGHDLIVESPCEIYSPTTVSSANVCLDSVYGFFNVSDVAIWTVTTLGGKLTSGTLLATFQEADSTYTCTYSLDPKNSSFGTFNGILIQDLSWLAQAPCNYNFEDEVFTISSGSEGVMNDANLDGDGATGSGTCVLR